MRLYIPLIIAILSGGIAHAQVDTSSAITPKANVVSDTTGGLAIQDTTANKVDSTVNLSRNVPVKRPVRPKRPKPISKEFSVGFRLNSDGWGIFVDKGWVKSEDRQSDLFYDIRLAQIELDEKKHPKELKRSNTLTGPGDDDSKPYIYGKINNFYTLKLGYGMRKMIAGKPEPKNVSIHWVYLGGLSMGMEKPYYLEALIQETAGGPTVQKNISYSDTTKYPFLKEQFILGGAGFSEGLSELKVIPGLHAKTALHFDFAAKTKTIIALETGVNAEIYTRAIAIMANQKAVPYFVNVYASLQFGKRK